MVALKRISPPQGEIWLWEKQERRGGIETETAASEIVTFCEKQERRGGIETMERSSAGGSLQRGSRNAVVALKRAPACRSRPARSRSRNAVVALKPSSYSLSITIWEEAGTPWWH